MGTIELKIILVSHPKKLKNENTKNNKRSGHAGAAQPLGMNT